MEAFKWDQNFVTGLERVDQEHRHLVELINALGEVLITGTSDDQSLERVFKELTDYAAYHFTEEEQLMQEAGVDARHADLHRRYHVDFVEQIVSMWKSRHAMSNPVEILHGFLRAWLSYHILGVDQALARQIASIRSGLSPAEAYTRETHPQDKATATLLVAMQSLYHVLSAQNRELVAANALLEERVAARTQELARANEALRDANHQLEALSNTDGLLKIANRRYFDRRLEEEWNRAAREGGKPLAVLMLDVDLFKHYNDTYGHQAGDRCLQSVAQAAASALRRTGDLVGRYGGEELIVMLPNTGQPGALRIAEEIRSALAARCIQHAGSPVAPCVTVSIGVASMVPDHAHRPEQLVAAADRGLYAAKEAGRDRIHAG